jgi:hypothetical protein
MSRSYMCSPPCHLHDCSGTASSLNIIYVDMCFILAIEETKVKEHLNKTFCLFKNLIHKHVYYYV